MYARPDSTTSVAVPKGKVKVISDRGSSAAPVPLAAGDEAQVLPNGRIQREHHASVAEAVAWQQRKLILKRTALEEMATEFNRYNKVTQIRLENIVDALRLRADQPGARP